MQRVPRAPELKTTKSGKQAEEVAGGQDQLFAYFMAPEERNSLVAKKGLFDCD